MNYVPIINPAIRPIIPIIPIPPQPVARPTELSFREKKILFLRGEQERLRTKKSSESELNFQQEVLRTNLLSPNFIRAEDKIKSIRKTQQVLKNLEKVEKEKEKLRERLKKEYAKEKEIKQKGKMLKGVNLNVLGLSYY